MRERWMSLWKGLGVPDGNAGCFREIFILYGEAHRHYHTLRHVEDCLDELDAARGLAKDVVAVELAIWFHDAVYDLRASDNEERSAALAKECLEKAGKADLIAKVGRLIMATKFHELNDGPDCALMLDIDLSILGKEESKFFQYEEQIRKEYSWVSEDVFRSKRAEILGKFLARDRIYRTDLFREKYEEQARRNLGESIRRLQGGTREDGS